MRLKKKQFGEMAEGDMTPMIDMTFQLIAFFMVLINFTEAEQDQRVELPSSVLAKPPANPLKKPLTIQITKDGIAIVNGEDYAVGPPLSGVLKRERRFAGSSGAGADSTTVIIRAHKQADTGKIQEIIILCQDNQFEKFRLRAEEDSGPMRFAPPGG